MYIIYTKIVQIVLNANLTSSLNGVLDSDDRSVKVLLLMYKKGINTTQQIGCRSKL